MTIHLGRTTPTGQYDLTPDAERVMRHIDDAFGPFKYIDGATGRVGEESGLQSYPKED